MASDEQAIVLGEGPETTAHPPQASRSPLRWVVPVFGVLGILVVSVWPHGEAANPESGPQGLMAPDEPAVSEMPEAAPRRMVVEELDARALHLVGFRNVAGLDHGAAGWLAVSSGQSVVAHVSRDGESWLSTTVHGMDGVRPRVAVGDRVLAVLGSNGRPGSEGPVAIGAVSSDGGDSWRQLIEHTGPIAIEDVGVFEDGVLAVGLAGEVPAGAWQAGSESTAGMWMVEGGSLRPIALMEAGAGSEARAISPEFELVFGSADGRPAVWTLAGERLPLEVPSSAPQRFVAVATTPAGLVGVVGGLDESGGSELWVSADGSMWESSPVGAGIDGITDVAVGPGGRLELAMAGRSTVWRQGSGLIDLGEVAGLHGISTVEASDETIVWAGDSDLGSVLLVSGSSGWPTEIVEEPGRGPTWRADARVELDEAPVPFATLTVGDQVFVVSRSEVFEVKGGGLEADIVPSVVAPEADPARAPQILLEGYDGSPVRVYPGMGGWTGLSRPLVDVLGIGRLDAAAFDEGAGPVVVVSRGESGRWVVTEDLPRQYHVVVPVEGGFVGQRMVEGEPEGPAVFSVDRRRWEPMGDWTLQPMLGSEPVLRSVGTPSVFALPAAGPSLVPVIQTYGLRPGGRVVRMGTDVVVEQGDSLAVGRLGGPTTLVAPTDIEHGVSGSFSVVPGAEPRLVMIDHGGLSLLSWR